MPTPADEQVQGQSDDQSPGKGLGESLDELRKRGADQEDRQAEGEQRDSVSDSPGDTKSCRTTYRSLSP